MKYNEIKKKTKDELIDLLKNLKKENYNLRFQKNNGQLKSPSKFREIKKNIARFKTLMKTLPLKYEKISPEDKYLLQVIELVSEFITAIPAES